MCIVLLYVCLMFMCVCQRQNIMIRLKVVVSLTRFFLIIHFATMALLRIHLITYYKRNFLSFAATKHVDQIFFTKFITISYSKYTGFSASSVLNANYFSCMRNCLHVLFFFDTVCSVVCIQTTEIFYAKCF